MRTVCLIFVAITLAGCSLIEFPPPESESASESVAETASAPAVVPVPEPVAKQPTSAPPPPPRKPPVPPLDKTAVATPADEPPDSPELMEPARLVGLGENQVTEQFGLPGAIRQEGAAMIWRYSAAGCWMDVFFFADLATGDRRVLTYEIDTRQMGDQPDAAGRCLHLIQSQAGQQG